MNQTPQSPETIPTPEQPKVETYQDKLDALVMEGDGSREAALAAEYAVLDSIYDGFKNNEFTTSRGEPLTVDNLFEAAFLLKGKADDTAYNRLPRMKDGAQLRQFIIDLTSTEDGRQRFVEWAASKEADELSDDVEMTRPAPEKQESPENELQAAELTKEAVEEIGGVTLDAVEIKEPVEKLISSEEKRNIISMVEEVARLHRIEGLPEDQKQQIIAGNIQAIEARYQNGYMPPEAFKITSMYLAGSAESNGAEPFAMNVIRRSEAFNAETIALIENKLDIAAAISREGAPEAVEEALVSLLGTIETDAGAAFRENNTPNERYIALTALVAGLTNRLKSQDAAWLAQSKREGAISQLVELEK